MKLAEMDERMRELSRKGTQNPEAKARHIQELLRAGRTTRDAIALAAFLSHPGAIAWEKMQGIDAPDPIDPSKRGFDRISDWTDALIILAEKVHSRDEIMQSLFNTMYYILYVADIRENIRSQLLRALSHLVDSPGNESPEVYELTRLGPRYAGGVEMGMRNLIRALNGWRADPDDERPSGTNDLEYAMFMVANFDRHTPGLGATEFLTRQLMPEF